MTGQGVKAGKGVDGREREQEEGRLECRPSVLDEGSESASIRVMLAVWQKRLEIVHGGDEVALARRPW